MTRGRKTLFIALTFLLVASAVLLGGELLTRLFWRGGLPADFSERSLAYRYDPELGWFPLTNSSARIHGNCWIEVRHNQDGFRDCPHGPKTKPRIAVVGDSFVWGYDVASEVRFTDRLQQRLADWEILNLGVSGYATDQELLLLNQWFPRYQPDVVVLAFCDNDLNENVTNTVHGGYYKPYFEKLGTRLVLRGVPVPKSVHYYRREHPLVFKSRLVEFLFAAWTGVRSPRLGPSSDPSLELVLGIKQFVEANGAKFILGFCTDLQADKKRAFCQACKVDYLFLLDSSLRDQGDRYIFPNLGYHWTPAGHEQVAATLFDFLTTNHFLVSVGKQSPGQRDNSRH